MVAGGRCVLLQLIADGVSVVAGRIGTVINRQKTGLLNIIRGRQSSEETVQNMSLIYWDNHGWLMI